MAKTAAVFEKYPRSGEQGDYEGRPTLRRVRDGERPGKQQVGDVGVVEHQDRVQDGEACPTNPAATIAGQILPSGSIDIRTAK